MKVSVELYFCQFLPYFVLFVTETLAIIHHDTGLTFGKAFQKVYPSYKPPKHKRTWYPMEKQEQEQATESSQTNPEALEANCEVRSFSQKLNHYDIESTRHFDQKYFVFKGNNYKKGNPVFLVVGGVHKIVPRFLEEGIWNHFAIETGALLLALEHRMYGSSDAFREYITDNLKYLNSEQALGDLIYFIENLTLNNPTDIIITPDTEWIALGSSYGGMLAARLKFKFPHKIKAAVTINAALLPTAAIEGFYTVVEDQCTMHKIDKILSDAFDEFDKGYHQCGEVELSSRQCLQSKYEIFQKTFNLCSHILSHLYDGRDHKYFGLWSLTTILRLALQFGNENERTLKTDVINILLNEEEISSPLDRLGAVVRLVLQSYNIPCLIVDYQTLLKLYTNTLYDAENNLNYILYTGLGNRLILYQRCTDLGKFETADKGTGLFAKHIPLDFYVNLCKNVFDKKFDADYLAKAIHRSKMFYGGRDMNVSNVLFIMHDNDLMTQLGYSGRKPGNRITEGDNITVLLKEEDGEQSVCPELIDSWNYILRTLKRWSGVKITKENNNEDSEQNTAVALTV